MKVAWPVSLPHEPGVYVIEHSDSGRVYVGSSVDLAKRLAEHRRALIGGYHANRYLQRAWNAFGGAAFTAQIIEVVSDISNLRQVERFHIVRLNSADPTVGFNLSTATAAGFGHSAETKEKLSRILIGHKRNVGRALSDGHKLKISLAQKGRPKSPEAIERVAAALRGKPCSPEAIAKRAQALRGKTVSEAERQRRSALMKSRWASGGMRFLVDAARQVNKGRTLPAEHVAAIAEGKRKAKVQRQQKG